MRPSRQKIVKIATFAAKSRESCDFRVKKSLKLLLSLQKVVEFTTFAQKVVKIATFA